MDSYKLMTPNHCILQQAVDLTPNIYWSKKVNNKILENVHTFIQAGLICLSLTLIAQTSFMVALLEWPTINTSYKPCGKVVGIAIASDRYFSKTDS